MLAAARRAESSWKARCSTRALGLVGEARGAEDVHLVARLDLAGVDVVELGGIGQAGHGQRALARDLAAGVHAGHQGRVDLAAQLLAGRGQRAAGGGQVGFSPGLPRPARPARASHGASTIAAPAGRPVHSAGPRLAPWRRRRAGAARRTGPAAARRAAVGAKAQAPSASTSGRMVRRTGMRGDFTVVIVVLPRARRVSPEPGGIERAGGRTG